MPQTEDNSIIWPECMLMHLCRRKCKAKASELGAAERDPGEAEKETMRKLAEISARLGEVLSMLNHPGYTPEEKELDHLGELIDDQISRQEEIIGDTEADQ